MYIQARLSNYLTQSFRKLILTVIVKIDAAKTYNLCPILFWGFIVSSRILFLERWKSYYHCENQSNESFRVRASQGRALLSAVATNFHPTFIDSLVILYLLIFCQYWHNAITLIPSNLLQTILKLI